MFICNAIFDVLFANLLGVFGIGLASTLSSLVAFLILLPAYINKKKTVHLEKTAFDKELLAEAVRRGAPTLLFNAGINTLIMKL